MILLYRVVVFVGLKAVDGKKNGDVCVILHLDDDDVPVRGVKKTEILYF